MSNVTIKALDDHPAVECAVVDDGIGHSNDAAAPLHEVRALSCFAFGANGRVVGGAVGRRWGSCCELQQLWVEVSHRHQGIATKLMQALEVQARSHGCTSFHLETFSFQAPEFYQALGYEIAHENKQFPHGIVKNFMVKQVAGQKSAA
jgi:GNAT superfamily N-acetyltransferase